MNIPHIPPRKIDAWIELMRAQQRLLDFIEGSLKTAGYPPLTWYDVLWELEKSDPEGLRPMTLEKQLLLPQYGLSRLLNRMEKHELIERHRTPEDGRGWVIGITPAGRRMKKKMWPIYAKALDSAFARKLTVQEAVMLRELLLKIGADRSS